MASNPAADDDKPRRGRSETDGELRFLTVEEAEAVLRPLPMIHSAEYSGCGRRPR